MYIEYSSSSIIQFSYSVNRIDSNKTKNMPQISDLLKTLYNNKEDPFVRFYSLYTLNDQCFFCSRYLYLFYQHVLVKDLKCRVMKKEG